MRAVSSFNWAPLRAVAESPAATTTDFDQCEHGQAARAPTRILALRMPDLHHGLTDTPGKGKWSHGRGAHQVLKGFDELAKEWRTAKKKTYTPALCAVLARSTAAAVHTMWMSTQDSLPEEMHDIEDQTEALRLFYVRWDPYLGHDESWAPDYVPQQQRKRKFDREASRFRLPEPAPGSSDHVVHDHDADPRPPGPPEATEEQEYIDATNFLREADPSSPPLASQPVAPPPAPPVLTPAQLSLIAAKRAEARLRRKAKQYRLNPPVPVILPANWFDLFS